MGAFELQIDTTTLLIGYGIALFLGIVGSLPPAIRIFPPVRRGRTQGNLTFYEKDLRMLHNFKLVGTLITIAAVTGCSAENASDKAETARQASAEGRSLSDHHSPRLPAGHHSNARERWRG